MAIMIPITDTSRVLVLSGAGISAESGVKTFRDAGGLWEGHNVTELASWQGFVADPLKVWRFYSARRAAMTGIVPNAAHHALVELEARLHDRFLLATQNVDGLHTAAGSQRIVEMHGNLMRSRCTACDRPAFADTTAYSANVAPMCGVCAKANRQGALRPDIVWFGEVLPKGVMDRIEQFIITAGKHLVFIAIGTSGVVHPAAALVDATRRVEGTSWLVNLEPSANATQFDHVVLGPAARELPRLLA
jgi:NAD-dependent deacetylase